MFIRFLQVCLILLVSSNSFAGGNVPDSEVQEARKTVKAFGGKLMGVLKPAMENEGPVAAIQACNIQAEPIADSASSSSDWQVSRTSLKERNEENKADEWELKILQQFEQRKAAGESVKKMEYSELVVSGDQRSIRYMKAIPTAKLCLSCHGSELSNEVSEMLKTHYPKDRATGFKVGDIRGAFSLQKSVR